MNKTLLVSLVGIGIVLLAGFFMFDARNTSSDDASVSRSQSDTSSNDGNSTSDVVGLGEQLAGSSSPYYVLTQSAYEEARASDKIVFLEFYADWCPICRDEQPEIKAGFDQLTRDDVVGFRANFKDADTDEFEKQLADELGVTYQHTKFIFQNRQELLRDGNPWKTQDFLDAFASL